MKKILLLLIAVIIVFIIYIFNIDKKVYYVNIADSNTKYNMHVKNNLNKKNQLEKYINVVDKDYRITDLINDIEDNKMINKKQTIQNVLIKADILTIKLGSNELKYKEKTKDIQELYDYIDEMIIDFDKLFKLIRQYDKEKVYYISYFDNKNEYYSEIYRYLDLKTKDLCDNYNIVYIKGYKLKNNEIVNNILQLKK